jgi:CheY-like chemotaxis protein
MPGTDSEPFRFRILVVDDEPLIVHTATLILRNGGYEVHTASDGFEALTVLSRSVPDILISDLSMPNMSGFELLSIVRRRFPQLPVIAISGDYNGIAPTGLIADAFLSKGEYSPEDLFAKIVELLDQAPIRASMAKSDRAPVWVPRNSAGYFVVTCPNCLRSFPVEDKKGKEYRETQCLHCNSTVGYFIDLPRLKQHPA